MLDRARILRLLKELDKELRSRGAIGELGMCGGAVMCLVFKARASTQDVDAVFAPSRDIREAARAVGVRNGLPADWLNDAAKGYFHADPPREGILDLPNLRVWAPTADYMLAMKCVSARFDGHDRDDVAFLIRYVEAKTPASVFRIIEKYYPRRMIPPKTQFLVQELFAIAARKTRKKRR